MGAAGAGRCGAGRWSGDVCLAAGRAVMRRWPQPAPHQPYYVGYNVDGFEVALAPGDVAGGPVVNADVEDLDATRATLLAAGATERSAPRQVAPEARVCVLADADGNPIGLRGQ